MLDYFADFVFTSLHAGTARAARRGPREGGVGGRVAVGVSLWVALGTRAAPPRARRPRGRCLGSRRNGARGLESPPSSVHALSSCFIAGSVLQTMTKERETVRSTVVR